MKHGKLDPTELLSSCQRTSNRRHHNKGSKTNALYHHTQAAALGKEIQTSARMRFLLRRIVLSLKWIHLHPTTALHQQHYLAYLRKPRRICPTSPQVARIQATSAATSVHYGITQLGVANPKREFTFIRTSFRLNSVAESLFS